MHVVILVLAVKMLQFAVLVVFLASLLTDICYTVGYCSDSIFFFQILEQMSVTDWHFLTWVHMQQRRTETI